MCVLLCVLVSFGFFCPILSVNEVGAIYCLLYVRKYLLGMFIFHSCDTSICLLSIYVDNVGGIWRRYIFSFDESIMF